MGGHQSHKGNRTDRRFGTVLFALRMGGIAVNMKTRPTSHFVYNVYLVLCYYVTYLSVFMNYLHVRDDFEESMKNVRMVFGMGLISFVHLIVRYLNL
jgi:hypothetical protein